MSENETIINGGAFKEFYSGAPMFRDKNGKPWMVNERGEPVTLGPGATPQPRQFDVHEMPKDYNDGGLRHWITNEYNVTEWIAAEFVLTNVPIPHVTPPQFSGWFVTDDGLRVVAPAETIRPVVEKRYRIIRYGHEAAVETAVNAEMTLGWTPCGGVAIDRDGWVCQAMVKVP